MIQTSSGMSLLTDSMEAVTAAVGDAMIESFDPTGGVSLVFSTTHHAGRLSEIQSYIRRRTGVQTVFGATGSGVIGPKGEAEQKPAISLLLVASDRLSSSATLLPPLEPVEAVSLLRQEIPGLYRERGSLVLVFDPRSLNSGFLPHFAATFPETPVVGAAAGWCADETRATLAVDTDVATSGAAALFMAGCMDSAIGVAQAVMPETQPREITDAQENVIARIENLEAADVLGEFVQSRQEQSKEPFEIFSLIAGAREDFDRSRYIVRNLIAVEPGTKRISVAEMVRPGQFISFGVRSAKNARRNFRQMLERLNAALVSRAPRAAIIFNCCARGQSLYGRPNVDFDALREFYPDLPVAGLFGFSEIGPISWSGRKVRSAILNHTSVVTVLTEPMEALGATG